MRRCADARPGGRNSISEKAPERKRNSMTVPEDTAMRPNLKPSLAGRPRLPFDSMLQCGHGRGTREFRLPPVGDGEQPNDNDRMHGLLDWTIQQSRPDRVVNNCIRRKD